MDMSVFDGSNPNTAAAVAAAAAAVAAAGPGAAERMLTNMMMAVTAPGSGGQAMSPAEARATAERALQTLPAHVGLAAPTSNGGGGGGGNGGGGALVPAGQGSGGGPYPPPLPPGTGAQWLESSPLMRGGTAADMSALVPAAAQLTGIGRHNLVFLNWKISVKH